VRLSIVVPAYNEERLLASTLESIRAAATGQNYELIVCDNNSTDRTADIAREHGATVVFEPVNQISRARNAGAAAATGDWLVFVDADSTPTKELLSSAIEALKTGCVGGGTTLFCDTRDRTVRAWVSFWNALSRTARWAAGSFIFCDAQAFRAAGGFSTELYAGEEIDFSRRMKRRGRFVILQRHPLVTSGRKAQLYTKREFFVFLLKTVLFAGRPLRDPKRAYLWYDGRR
jgi:glycosyltransferase involved in cell wall biosynthesis